MFERDARLGDGLLEGVEVDDDEVDGLDAVLGRLLAMLVVVAQEEESAVDFRFYRRRKGGRVWA
jgi:hypothetical protein